MLGNGNKVIVQREDAMTNLAPRLRIAWGARSS
jgi:hypothetical protein